MRVPPVVLSIAGYDPSSGAGVTADVKTAAALGCYAATCIAAITVQTTQGVFEVQPLKADMVAQILRSLAEDLEIKAIRLGMLGSGEVAAVVADFLESARLPNVVLDPVIRSSSGAALLDEAGLEVMRERLIPLCDVLTPNIHEVAALVGSEPLTDQSGWESALPKLRELSAGIHRLGAKAVVITGGHLDPANDYLSYAGGEKAAVIAGERVESRSTHGTGCAYATAIACRLALGDDLLQAARAAKEYVRRAIQSAYPVGKGTGPINHLG
jgi:hydroxymethylpyrimidine/phosphomethylpyrimidine kinase